MPFIKAGIISANVEGRPRRIYVDAHGNPGFSGGPLVLRPLGQPLTVPVVVAGVIIDLPLDPITAEQTGLVRATKHRACRLTDRRESAGWQTMRFILVM